nr:MAG TPA: hypothetical protein [Caudoviricetes sp.]DAM19776.1 MAG TPA: hypothetical protein [Caudoviricetes sp.]
MKNLTRFTRNGRPRSTRPFRSFSSSMKGGKTC